jgi:hypothetical protein
MGNKHIIPALNVFICLGDTYEYRCKCKAQKVLPTHPAEKMPHNVGSIMQSLLVMQGEWSKEKAKSYELVLSECGFLPFTYL